MRGKKNCPDVRKKKWLSHPPPPELWAEDSDRCCYVHICNAHIHMNTQTYFPKRKLLGLWNVACMYVFRDEPLPCSSLGMTLFLSPLSAFRGCLQLQTTEYFVDLPVPMLRGKVNPVQL